MKKLLLALAIVPVLVWAAWSPDTLPKDSFERVQTANPFTVFDNIFQYGSRGFLFEFQTNASATITHIPATSSIRLDSWTNGSAWVQSKQWFRYIPGKGQLYLATVVLPATSTNANMIQRFGQYSDDNGLFWIRSNGVMGVVIRSSASGAKVDTIVNQTSWNIDKFDGTGPSGRTLQTTNGNIYGISYQWLGYGKVVFSIDYDGKLWPVHSFDHQGGSLPYMTTATLPVRWGLENLGTVNGTNSLTATCVSLLSNGSSAEDYDRGFVFDSGNDNDKSVNSTYSVLVSIRPAITFNSITNRSTIVPIHYDMTSSANAQYQIQYSAVVTGGTWFAANANSAVEVSTNAVFVSAGTIIEQGFLTAGAGASARGDSTGNVTARLPIVLDNAGTNQSLGIVLILKTLTGNGTARGAIQWRELR